MWSLTFEPHGIYIQYTETTVYEVCVVGSSQGVSSYTEAHIPDSAQICASAIHSWANIYPEKNESSFKMNSACCWFLIWREREERNETMADKEYKTEGDVSPVNCGH